MLPNSLILTLTSLIIAYVFGVLAGAWLAWKRGSWLERAAVPVVLATRAAPEFWIGMVLLALLSFKLGWFPSGGASSPGEAYTSNWQRIFSLDYLQHLALPVHHARPLPAGPAVAADALQHARGDARGVRHHGAHEGPVANGASSSATPRATRCCRW